jgi:4-amino-4-deoxy-L-arabinose transferase-like glycosyltransferase
VSRVSWLIYIHPNPNDGRFDDTVWYRNSAHFLAAGEGYLNPFSGTKTAAWPPGYPAFLAGVFRIFGEGDVQTYAANVVVALLTIVVVYAVALLLFDQRTAALTALLLAIWPGQVYFSSLTLSEVFFTLLFATAVLCALVVPQLGAWRGAGVVVFALVTASAVLTRGQAALLLPLAVVAWRLSGMQWRASILWGILAAIVIGVVLAPWALRNDEQLGSPVIIATNLGPNLWLGNHAGASGRMDTAVAMPLPDHSGVSEPEFEVKASDLALRKGLGYIVTHPSDELRLAGAKIRAMYEADSTAVDWNSAYKDDRYSPDGAADVLRGVANAFWFGALILGGVGLIGSRRELKTIVALVPLTILLWTAAHAVFIGDGRYHYPIVFAIALLSARGLVVLFEGVRRPQAILRRRYAPA